MLQMTNQEKNGVKHIIKTIWNLKLEKYQGVSKWRILDQNSDFHLLSRQSVLASCHLGWCTTGPGKDCKGDQLTHFPIMPLHISYSVFQTIPLFVILPNSAPWRGEGWEQELPLSEGCSNGEPDEDAFLRTRVRCTTSPAFRNTSTTSWLAKPWIFTLSTYDIKRKNRVSSKPSPFLFCVLKEGLTM